MSKQMLMYEKVAPLNKTAHKNLYLKPGKEYGFAKALNSVPLTLVEFPNAASEYTIVFTGSETQVMPAVIMGLKKDENLYISESEAWKAKYVPAFVRRYPFIFSGSEDSTQLTLCIDESYSGCNEEGRGERLFDVDGEQTQYLKGVLAFMEEYQAQYHRTKAFCDRLLELDLLQPMTAKFGSPDKGTDTITGFKGIDREKLKQLPAETLAEFAKNDWLELIYIHLHSIRNFGFTLERVSRVDVANETVAA